MNWCGVPPKRLFLASDRDAQNSQDSAFSSHIMSSQMQDSQCSEFSQVATQDMFSQSNSGPQTEVKSSTQHGMKKMSMYEKWLSKRSMIKRDPPPTGSFESKTSLQVTSLNNTAQAQGYSNMNNSCNTLTRHPVDSTLKGSERDLLKQVTFAIHDCSSEMKTALFAVKEKLENVTEMSNEQLAQTLTSFLDDIWKHQEKLQQLLQEQDKSKTMVTDLEVKLAKKETQIAMLEEQLLLANKDNTPRFAKAVRCEMQSPQLLLQHKIEEILEWARDTKEQQDNHLKEYKHSMEAQCKQYLNLSKTGQSNLKETEKRILSELRKIPDKLEFKQRELHNQLTEDIKNCLHIYKGDFEDMIKHLIRHCFNQHIHGPEEVITALQKGSIQDILRTQLEVVGVKLGDVMNNYIMKNGQQLANIQDTLSENNRQIKEMLHAKHFETDALAQVEVRLTCFQSALKQQLDDTENKHSREIRELGNILYKHLKYSADKETTKDKHDVSNFAVQLNPVMETSSAFTNPHLLSGRPGNYSALATTCAKHNTSKSKKSADFSEIDSINGHDDSDEFPNYFQVSRGFTNGYKYPSNINKGVPNSIDDDGAERNPRQLTQTTKVSEKLLEQHAVYCHPPAEYEVSFRLKSGTSPVTSVASHRPEGFKNMTIQNIAPKQTMQQPEGFKNMTIQNIAPKQTVEQPEEFAIPSKPKKRGKRKRIFSVKKKNTNNKYVEKMTAMSAQATHSLPTSTWTRSYIDVYRKNEITTLDDSQRAHQFAESGCKYVGDQQYSWSHGQDKTAKHGITKGELSVYDFPESDMCNTSVISRKRNHVSSNKVENMSLASFINKGCVENRNKNSETGSECSSPTISITKMAIRRNVRTPFRRPGKVALCKLDTEGRQSPAPTLLSEISKM